MLFEYCTYSYICTYCTYEYYDDIFPPHTSHVLKLLTEVLMLSPGTEWTGSKERMLAGIITDYFFGFGYILLAGIAFLIRDWRKLQLAISAPGFLFIFYIW